MQDVWNALSDPTRRKILELLRERNRNAGEIASEFDMSKPSISHHLSILRTAGLVDAEKKGQQVEYSLNTTVFQDLLAFLIKLTQKEEQKRDDNL